METCRKAYALKKWHARRILLGSFGEQIEKELNRMDGERKDWMLYLMATLPLSDLANYPLSAWEPYIDHALKLRTEISWCRDLDEGIFADYVFYPRINTEDIEECRQLFYSELAPRIQGMTEEEAVIETNYWCQEHVTYQMADDRTKSAMTAYRSCGGRCGEESTFTVTALRAIGVPSRQVYAPWWSHCDDNHAWVEVLIDGKWHFMGACEAAPKLDTGWFTNASSRAMVVHARTFTGADNDGELKELYGDRAYRFHVEDGVTYEHVTDLYAPLTSITVSVKNEAGEPLQDALVRFEILNMAEMMSAANIRTGRDGTVTTQLGRGQVHLHAILKESDGKTAMAEQDVVLGEEPVSVTLTLRDPAVLKEKNGEWQSFDFYAPLDTPMNPGILTDEEKELRSQKRLKGTALREARIAESYHAEQAVKQSEAMQQRLHDARGNFDEIIGFLDRTALDDGNWREAMLSSLTVKDMTDVKAAVLEEHLICSVEYAQDYKPEIFVPYVLCPRVFNETLTQYRTFILQYFDDETKKSFRRDPQKIVDWMAENLKEMPAEEYGALFYTPAASLRSLMTTPMSRRILFTAICRTLGVAAGLNPNTREAEFMKGHHFVSAEKQISKSVQLVLEADDPKEWINRQTFTLGHLVDGSYQRVDMPAITEKNTFELALEPGEYRLLTSNRLPNGHTYAYAYYFAAENGHFGKGNVAIALKKREARLTEILSRNSIRDFALKDADGNRVTAGSLLEKRTNILIWIEEGKEPTEHILNEMLMQPEEFRNAACDIFFILKNEEAEEQVTLRRALEAFPSVRIYYDDFTDNVQALGRRMYVDPDKLPLVLLLHDGLCGVYASSGYNVGLGDLLLKIVKAFES